MKKKQISPHVLAREGLSTDGVEVAKGTVFQEIRAVGWFQKTGDFVK